MIASPPPAEIAALAARLRELLGPAAVVAAADSLRTYDADASMLVAHPPDLVALPATPAQAAAAARLAAAAGLPLVARGAGTGIAGGAVPVRGGLVISTARLDHIDLGLAPYRAAIVGAGVVNADLNAALAPLGLQFAPDPSSQRASTIGGNLATNAGGPHCLKYGVTTNHILAVELVRPGGEQLWTGDGAPAAPGYDLTGLVVGSEGTFGLVTRAMVRLTPLPEANRVVLALFPSVVAASSAVSRIIAAGSLPTSLEVMDHNAIRAVNGAYGLGLPEAEGTTLLIVEVDGVEDGLEAALEEILAICRAQGAFELRPARSPAEQARVWTARKSVAGAIGRLAPAYLLVDTVVPRTRLPLMMEAIERLRREQRMEVCNVFHAGDGNLHPLVLYDPRDAEQRRRAHAIAHGVLELSIQQGGVISGEHGIGLEKQEYLPLLFSEDELRLHATVHQLFNPAGQFNPAKIFPGETPPAALAAERRGRMLGDGETGGAGDRGSGRWGEREMPDGVDRSLRVSVSSQRPVEPATIEELSALVGACHRAGTVVVPTGAAAPPASAAPGLLVSTRGLNRVLQYEPDDLTIGVEAGMTLAELRALIEPHGQILPLEVAAPERATLGALVAAGASGPRRLGYGGLRDWLLALTVVEPDGAVLRLGAQVVKNVTGYDLVKMYIGSRGTLGVIAALSLRLFPRPPASATFALACPGRAAALQLAARIGASRLQPGALVYLEGWSPLGGGAGPLLLLRAEGRPEAVERHGRDLAALAGAAPLGRLAGAEEQALWSAVAAESAAAGAGLLLRVSLPPGTALAALLADADRAAGPLQLRVTAEPLGGLATIRAAGPPGALQALHRLIWERHPHTRLLAGDPAPGTTTWGRPGAAADLMAALKAAVDPLGTMNPGEPGPWGAV